MCRNIRYYNQATITVTLVPASPRDCGGIPGLYWWPLLIWLLWLPWLPSLPGEYPARRPTTLGDPRDGVTTRPTHSTHAMFIDPGQPWRHRCLHRCQRENSG